VTIWYTAPTALRMLIQDETRILDKYTLPALKRVYSVGEPLNPEIIHWVRRVVKREIYDTWFQTETGAIMISNRPGLEVHPGSMGKPLQSIEAYVLAEDYSVLGPEMAGSLCLKKGWPSMYRTYLNMEEQYKSKFHGDYYNTGDQAKKDADGYFWFIGRNDDVINTSGHLVGPFEVESVLLEMEEIVDVAVIGAPDEMLFEKIVAFVKLKEGLTWSKGLEVQARIRVTRQVSPIAVPSEFVVVDRIPKNRSGKIMRRVLKAQYTGQDVGDISTMED
jgi:acetyl-CoA synthetase